MRYLFSILCLLAIGCTKAQNSYQLKNPVFADKPRKPNANFVYSGTKRYVGPGLTYTTLTAAIAASASLDSIIIVKGTYNVANESGGYLLLNDYTKQLYIQGDSSDRSLVTFIQTASASFGVRVRTCLNWTFKNITFTSNQTTPTINLNLGTASSPVKVAFINCVVRNTNGAGATVVSMDVPANSNYIEFKDCEVTNNYSAPGSSSFSFTAPSSVNDANKIAYPSPIVITGTTMNSQNWGDIAADITMYDCNVIQTGNAPNYIFGIGSDTNAPTDSSSNIDIRGCAFRYAEGIKGNGHAVLLGRGTKKMYFTGNYIKLPTSTNSLELGLVIKCIALRMYDVIICANYSEAPRPIYLKGAQNCYLMGNTTKSVWGDLTDGFGFEINNPNNGDGPIASTGNVVIFNTFNGHIGGMKFLAAGGATATAVSTLTCTFHHNIYTVDAGTAANYLQADGTTYSFAGRGAFWAGSVSGDYPAEFKQY